MMRKVRRMGKGLCILSALLLMFAVVGCDDSDTTQPVSKADVAGVEPLTNRVTANIAAGGTITTEGVEGNTGEVNTTIARDNNTTPKANGAPLGDGTVSMTVEAKEANSNDMSMPAFPNEDLDNAGFNADAKAYYNSLNEGDNVTFDSLGETVVSAVHTAADGTETAVDEFTQAKRFAGGPLRAMMRLGYFPGAFDGMRVPIFFVTGGAYTPVAFVPIAFDMERNVYYAQFYFSRMGQYRCGWHVPRVKFNLLDSMNDNCRLTLTVSENGAGDVTSLAYSFTGDFGASGSAEGDNFTIPVEVGTDQIAIVKVTIHYELPNGYTRTFVRKWQITADCVTGTI